MHLKNSGIRYKFSSLCLLFLGINIFICNTLYAQKYLIKTIVIDAGHGGSKPGSIGRLYKEKTVALKVALALGTLIKNNLKGVKVIYTRTSDKDVDLHKRASIANNAKADLFISIHLNSLPKRNSPGGYGTETIVAGTGRLNEQDLAIRENADIFTEKDYKKNYSELNGKSSTDKIMYSIMKSGSRQRSIQLAKLIQKNYAKAGRKSRGVKEQNILILQRCAMPAVLTEIGFLSNSKEESFLNTKVGQHKIANSIYQALKEYKKLNERK